LCKEKNMLRVRDTRVWFVVKEFQISGISCQKLRGVQNLEPVAVNHSQATSHVVLRSDNHLQVITRKYRLVLDIIY